MSETYDHRWITSCACVERHLRTAVEKFAASRQCVEDATDSLNRPDAACDAVELIKKSYVLRREAEEEVTAALRAFEDPPPIVSTGTPSPASGPGSTPTPAA